MYKIIIIVTVVIGVLNRGRRSRTMSEVQHLFFNFLKGRTHALLFSYSFPLTLPVPCKLCYLSRHSNTLNTVKCLDLT
ncbi:hypothetical protein EJD97_006870 [Solanum chilense]|uniref:Uncharacterized protein n=1 Tax=Solanum chilense TaxID=4083 RepID=A0A6N2AKW5_SOLCI|nr:hypothetical protein EJD97_006870 [Solanum chilense]